MSNVSSTVKSSSELTPYAIQFRYPDAAAGSILAEDIERALTLAEKVVDEMCSRIPFDGAWDI